MMRKAIVVAVAAVALPVSVFAAIHVGGNVVPMQMNFVTTEPGTLTWVGASLIGLAGLVRRNFKA